MAACLKLVIVVFLALVPIVFPSPLVVSNAQLTTPSENITCSWVVKNEELDCNGLIFLYEAQDTIGGLKWWLDFCLVLFLVLFAGISSGLTIGLIGMDYTKLEVLSKSGTPREQAAARKIIPIVSNHHLLLVTLLLATASAEEAMPLFLERMMPAWASIVVSVILVLIFAEVIPMAICTRYGLDVGAKLSWLVHVFIWVAYPVAYPISKALDWTFGHSAGSLFKRSQLKELIDMHSRHSIHTAKDVEAELAKLPVEDRLTSQEVQLIKNALDLNSRTAIELSTPIDEVYMLEYSQICDREVMGSIIHYGLHFCVPVYRENRDHIIGMIRVSDLIELSPDDNAPISSLELDAIVNVPSDLPVYRAMTLLQANKSSLAILSDPKLTRIPVAVLTMEDIIEELVAGQIADIPLFPESREGENVMEEWLQSGDNSEEPHEILNFSDVHSNASVGTTASLPARSRPDFFRNTSANSFFLPGMRRQGSNSSLVSNGSTASTREIATHYAPASAVPGQGLHGSHHGLGHSANTVLGHSGSAAGGFVPNGMGQYPSSPNQQQNQQNQNYPKGNQTPVGAMGPSRQGSAPQSPVGSAAAAAGHHISRPGSPLASRDGQGLPRGAQSPNMGRVASMAAPPFSMPGTAVPATTTPVRHAGSLHHQQYLHPQYHTPHHIHQAHQNHHVAAATNMQHLAHPLATVSTQLDSIQELERGMVDLDDFQDHHDPASTPLRESGKWARQARRGKWVRAAPADFETSSNASSASSNASTSSHASYASGYSDHFAGNEAASYSSTSSAGGKLLKVEKKRAKDPHVAQKN
jgi:CBS domain containing-hemolysin-like protein